jgi:hypothetical protein
MTNIDLGTTGAKRATWRETNPRSLLNKIVNDNPIKNGQDEDQWKRRIGDLFWKAIEDDTDYLNAICQYWLDHNMRSLLGPSPEEKTALEKEKKEKQAAKLNKAADEIKERVNTEVERRARIVLLDLVTVNGKELRYCNKFECRAFGGWYTELAKQMPDKKTVGQVFTEEKLHVLWNKYAVVQKS